MDPLRFRLPLFMTLLFTWGCGYQTYEERLARTHRFYEYLAMLDEHLARQAWNRAEWGMSMRIPKGFQAMPGPPPPQNDDEGNLIYAPDPRQPHFLGVELDGLVDGWQAQLPNGTALLYVFSNHERHVEHGASSRPPNTFLAEWELAVASAFQQQIPEGESPTAVDNVRFRVTVPERTSLAAEYVSPKEFIGIRLVSAEPIGGQEIQGLVYEYQSGAIQVAVLCLCPKDVGLQFRDRLLMALQTLQVTPQIPGVGGGGPGTPSGGGGASGF